MTAKQVKLMKDATKILKSAGYRWDGRQSEKVSGNQTGFEKAMVKAPFSGRSTRRK